MTPTERKACLTMLNMFVIDGKPADEVASEGQIDIFYNLIFRPYLRLQILCSTQYGKSLFVALACIIITCCQHEVVAVLAPTDEKVKIIMRYYIQHLGDHPDFKTELEKNTKLDRLRMEETKERIMLKHGGGIFVISVHAGNSIKGMEAAMGAGAKIVIQDESGLIPDQIEATVYRMIAGKGPEAFYCKIGNPFYRNHFLTSSKDLSYHQILISYKQGLKEGRYTEAFIAEARKKPFFSILYECRFPGEGMVDSSGTLQLFPPSKVVVREFVRDLSFFGRVLLGIDPAGEGKDKATFVLRDRFRAEKIHEMATSNARQIAEIALGFIDKYKIKAGDTVIDAMGEGADVGKEIALSTKGKYEAYTVLVGNAPRKEEEYNGKWFLRHPDELVEEDEDNDLYLNIRALMYFRAKEWVIGGGEIVDENVDNSLFKSELGVIRYKRSLQGNKIQLLSKLDMLKLGIPSPNTADAFALTFLRDIDDLSFQTEEQRAAIREEEGRIEDPHSIF